MKALLPSLNWTIPFWRCLTFFIMWPNCIQSADYGFDEQKEATTNLPKRSEFLKMLLLDYDHRLPPNFDGEGPTHVDCDIFISSFDTISETTMDYVVSIFMRQKWQDTRLAFAHLSNESMVILDSRLADAIWLPDLFFTNEKSAYFHSVTKPNRFLRLHKNGTLYYSARLSLTLSCPMKLHKFPLDTQLCSIQMESYAYTTEQLIFHWRDAEAVELNEELELPQFNLDKVSIVESCVKKYHTGMFSCLKVDFVLTRDVGFYMIQTYIPSALIVGLSWVSFWINIDAVPARISLGVLTILTMTTQTTGSTASLPRVSYIKAIDIWMSTCLVFVFAALLEFAIVNVLSRKEIRRMVTMKRTTTRSKCNGNDTFEFLSDDSGVRRESLITDPTGKHKARTVDKVARKLFPAAFILFNVVYWLTYIFWQPIK